MRTGERPYRRGVFPACRTSKILAGIRGRLDRPRGELRCARGRVPRLDSQEERVFGAQCALHHLTWRKSGKTLGDHPLSYAKR